MRARFLIRWGTLLAVLLALGACKSVQTTQGGSVGVDRTQYMMLSSSEVDKAAVQAYTQTLQQAQKKGALNQNAGQVARVRALRASRDAMAVDRALEEVGSAARGSGNVLPSMREALRARATLGEVSDVLRTVFGEYEPR